MGGDFKYEVINVFDNRKDAVKDEKEMQRKYDVVKSKQYFNKSFAV